MVEVVCLGTCSCRQAGQTWGRQLGSTKHPGHQASCCDGPGPGSSWKVKPQVRVRPSGGTQGQTLPWDGQAGLQELETGTAAALPGQGLTVPGGWNGVLGHGQGGESPQGGQSGPIGPISALRALAVA